jgi:hypothetical protein
VSGFSTSPVGGVTPVGVRTGTETERTSAAQAVAFERLLLGELTKVLADPEVISGGESQSGATSMLMGQLPEILADSLSQSGGIGLAAALQPSFQGGAR